MSEGYNRRSSGSAGSSSFIPQAGFWVPKGALDRWKTKRALSASQLIEVAVIGDSTTYGQTATGNNTTSANNYSWVQKLRALSVAGGYGDGGLGTRGFYDTANMSGPDALAHVQSSSGIGAAGSTFFNVLQNWGISSGAAGTIGGTITVQGKGSQARVWYSQISAGTAVLSWSADGGASSGSISGVSGSSATRTQYLDIPLTGAGTHTITFTLTTGGQIEIVVDWLNATGIVWHKIGSPGVKLSSDFGSNVRPWLIAPMLGLGVGQDAQGAAPLNVPYGMSVTGPRTPALAIFSLGLNDLLGTTSGTFTTDIQAIEGGIGTFAMMCAQAGVDAVVCIPHMTYANNALLYGGHFRRAIYSTALAYGLAVFDIEAPLGTPATAAASYALAIPGSATPHPNQAGYDAQATALWTALSTI